MLDKKPLALLEEVNRVGKMDIASANRFVGRADNELNQELSAISRYTNYFPDSEEGPAYITINAAGKAYLESVEESKKEKAKENRRYCLTTIIAFAALLKSCSKELASIWELLLKLLGLQ